MPLPAIKIGFPLYNLHRFLTIRPGASLPHRRAMKPSGSKITCVVSSQLDWVLDRYYPTRATRQVERSVRVPSAHESDLIQLMEALSGRHPDAKLFSLPHISAVNTIEIGFRGE